MTVEAEGYNVIIIPAEVLFKSSDAVKRSLMEVINLGYDKVRYKYNVILTPRIKSVETFFSDLGFQDNGYRCFLYFLVRKGKAFQLISNFHESFERVCQPAIRGIDFYKPGVESLNFEVPFQNISAVIGYKPTSESTFEITGFTSVARGCGSLLANLSLLHLKEQFHPSKLVANVIVDHELVGYYEEVLGFTETSRSLFDVDNRQGFEESLVASKNFSIAKLEKSIKYDK